MTCTVFDAAQCCESQFEGNVFEVVFFCTGAGGTSNISLFTGTRLVDENGVDVNVAVSVISISCVGGAEDKDGDGCSHEQELANVTDSDEDEVLETKKNRTNGVREYMNT